MFVVDSNCKINCIQREMCKDFWLIFKFTSLNLQASEWAGQHMHLRFLHHQKYFQCSLVLQ